MDRRIDCRNETLARIACACLLLASTPLMAGVAHVAAAPQAPPKPGVLLLAHGGSPQWNDNVRALAARVDNDRPVEVAFGMATRANIQTAVDALVARGVTEIIAVPLFVSSHSSVVTSTEYLLGLRTDAPADLAKFATMSHGSHGAAGHDAHAGHTSGSADGTRPVKVSVPVRMSGALDSHPIVAAILADRARAISTDPSREAVVLVAHGPVNDTENDLWLRNMATLADGIRPTASYASIDWMTVRDDAPAPIRDAATAELRSLVARRQAAGSRVLVVPVLLSFGGVEQGIRKRLEGLDFVMAPQGIMPDERVGNWIEAQLAK